MSTSPTRPAARPSIVIVGAGFGGLPAARALARTDADLTVIDRRNYHLFQPLLYQVATSALSPADIAWPVRGLLARQANARVVMDRVTAVDTAGRRVLTESGGAFDEQVPIGQDRDQQAFDQIFLADDPGGQRLSQVQYFLL